MTSKQTEYVAKTSGSPQNEDRFTLVFTSHFLEWDTGAVTDVRWAYDRLSPSGQGTCFQASVRANPGQKVKVALPGDFDKFERRRGHKVPQMAGNDPLLQEQQNLNVIEIWDDEKVLGILSDDRMMFGQFKGPLYYVSSRSTAILSITAFPV
jgi:hypothetical protein